MGPRRVRRVGSQEEREGTTVVERMAFHRTNLSILEWNLHKSGPFIVWLSCGLEQFNSDLNALNILVLKIHIK